MPLFTVEIIVGKGEKAKTYSYTADSLDMPLALVEAAQDGKMAILRESITEFMDIPEEVSKHLTVRHVNQISAAVAEASKLPNAS